MSVAILALGSNMGDRAANLQEAVRRLGEADVAVRRASSIWETPPVPAGQPAFLNAVIVATTGLRPHALLALAKAIEWEMGRRPGERWGPRPIDIDILFYDEMQLESDDLVVPHPRIAERAFVLVPLAEVVEDPLPVLRETAQALLAPLDRTGITKQPGQLLMGESG